MACEILVPRSEIEPPCPALEGGFLTTGPSEKSHKAYFGPLYYAVSQMPQSSQQKGGEMEGSLGNKVWVDSHPPLIRHHLSKIIITEKDFAESEAL